MKKGVLISLLVILAVGNLAAQEVSVELVGEMQISGGAEFAFGAFKIDNNIAFYQGSSAYFLNEKSTLTFLAPGFSLYLRYFTDLDSLSSRGFFFRDRAIFISNGELTGTGSLNDYPFSISANYSMEDDNAPFTSIMDFSTGISYRYIISDGFQFYTDFGVNFTIMDSESEGETLSYWGGGLYTAMAFQVNLTKTMYLELGINSIINAFSSQNGEFYNVLIDRTTKYEDTGRWDLMSVAAYLNIGWRMDVQQIKIKRPADK